MNNQLESNLRRLLIFKINNIGNLLTTDIFMTYLLNQKSPNLFNSLGIDMTI